MSAYKDNINVPLFFTREFPFLDPWLWLWKHSTSWAVATFQHKIISNLANWKSKNTSNDFSYEIIISVKLVALGDIIWEIRLSSWQQLSWPELSCYVEIESKAAPNRWNFTAKPGFPGFSVTGVGRKFDGSVLCLQILHTDYLGPCAQRPAHLLVFSCCCRCLPRYKITSGCSRIIFWVLLATNLCLFQRFKFIRCK